MFSLKNQKVENFLDTALCFSLSSKQVYTGCFLLDSNIKWVWSYFSAYRKACRLLKKILRIANALDKTKQKKNYICISIAWRIL